MKVKDQIKYCEYLLTHNGFNANNLPYVMGNKITKYGWNHGIHPVIWRIACKNLNFTFNNLIQIGNLYFIN